MSFDETQHPREASGKFTAKEHSAAEATLNAPVFVPAREVDDPWEHFPEYPTTLAREFEDAQTFEEVDERYRLLFRGNDFHDALWAAVERGRQLRRDGTVQAVPTKLEGRIAGAQNDAELVELYSHEISDDGPGISPWKSEKWAEVDARRRELLDAGVVHGYELKLG